MAQNPTETAPPAAANGEVLLPAQPTHVEVRMYCMGTGDCFVLKFYAGEQPVFTMMIDCGSCVGDEAAFRPYVENIADWVGAVKLPAPSTKPAGTRRKGEQPAKWAGGRIDLLVVTHEHNDHVNGFAKCRDIFEAFDIRQAWFAWTENPNDPSGAAQDLRTKRVRMREGFQKALDKVRDHHRGLQEDSSDGAALAALASLVHGLETLGEINLDSEQQRPGAPLAGMQAIKELVTKKPTTTVRYLSPGTTITFPQLAGVKFHVLGPPLDKKYIYKNGREGKDVHKRHFSVGEGILAMNSFAKLGTELTDDDLPFERKYVVDVPGLTDAQIGRAPHHMQEYLKKTKRLLDGYSDREEQWRRIENEWLYTAGSLAIRLNSHINNTSLALAVEVGQKGKVLLLPGDAEYGSWESWHMIEKWDKAGPSNKHLVEDLLNRTVFYKVSHHLSYNGTPLAKGIKLMTSSELTTMVTLDRTRISSRWITTMPNAALLSELMERCEGRCFIMSEAEITPPPSATMSPQDLKHYKEHSGGVDGILWKQYSVQL